MYLPYLLPANKGIIVAENGKAPKPGKEQNEPGNIRDGWPNASLLACFCNKAIIRMSSPRIAYRKG